MRRERILDSEVLASRERFLKSFIDLKGSLRFGQFKLSNETEQAQSRVYADVRNLRRHLDMKRLAISLYEDKLRIRCMKFDFVADVPTGVTFLVSSLSDRIVVPMITPRESKSHGSGSKVEGMLEEDKGKTAVVVEDVITTGASVLKSVRILRENGINVTDAIALIEREQGGRELLAEEGVKLNSIFTLSEILAYGIRAGKFDKQFLVNHGIEVKS